MTNYELLLAIAEDQSEEEQKKILSALTQAVEKAKGEVAQTDSWGKKTLAFPVEKNTSAFFWLLNVAGQSNLPKVITDGLRIEDKVLRFIVEKKVLSKKPKKAPKKKVVTTEIIR